MSQGLHLSQRMALSQVLAPQLQQSLNLLQAPTLELKALVEQELQLNPLLEEVGATEVNQKEGDGSDDGAGNESSTLDAGDDFDDPDSGLNGESDRKEPVDDFDAEFQKLSQLDQEWRDHFAQTNTPIRRSQEEEERRQFMFDSLVAETSLQEELQEQVRVSDLDEDGRSVAEMLIGNIDDYGYLQSSVEELAFSTNIDPERILKVLSVLQSFDPPGVAARDLRECLLLQLERRGDADSIEYQIVDLYMDALGKRRLPEISKGLGIGVEEVQAAVERIGRLETRPGRAFLPDNQQYVLPEVFVEKDGDDFKVTTNNEQLPHLRISNLYKDLMSKAESSGEVREYVRDKIRAGKFLIKSLHQRQDTITNIANEIVKRQREFMEGGVAHLKPMTMIQVAEAVGVHETTVSRAVSGKYIQTPQGVFEMKYFFTSGIQTASGDGVSNTSVKGMISELIEDENSRKPLSDEEIVKLLSGKGIKIARRTVAKYRSELNVLPSHLRRRYD